MLTTLRSLWSNFVRMLVAAREAIPVVAVFAGLVGLALSVFLSPLLDVLKAGAR